MVSNAADIPARTARIVSPVDGTVIAERELAGDDDIQAALAAAGSAQRQWKRRPLA